MSPQQARKMIQEVGRNIETERRENERLKDVGEAQGQKFCDAMSLDADIYIEGIRRKQIFILRKYVSRQCMHAHLHVYAHTHV